MLDLNSDLLLNVSNIAIRAGSEIMKFYSEDPEIFTKNDNSPLTQADLSSNQIIIEELKKIDETIPILRNYGAFKIFSSAELKNFEDSQSIKISYNNPEDNIRVISSRSHSNDVLESWMNKKFNKYTLIISGSSLKFCEIAEGNADIYPRFGHTSEWDIAAGHIILEEAGGVIKDIDGNQILYKYNNKETLINPDFIATNNLKLI